MAKTTVKLTVIGLALLSLTGCSTLGKHKNQNNGQGAEVSDANGVSSTGLGDETSFAKGRKSPTTDIANQTYYFDFDQSELRGADKRSIDAQARYLADHPNAKVVLDGNTDPRGSREYNMALGMRRSLSVADVLKLEGASNNQVRTNSYGAEKLASEGTTEEDYQLDRRVELKYEDKG